MLQLGTAVDPLVRGWIGQLRDRLDATIANGGDLAEFSDALLYAYSDLSVDAAGQVIGDALTVAEMTGNADVQDEMAARRKGRKT